MPASRCYTAAAMHPSPDSIDWIGGAVDGAVVTLYFLAVAAVGIAVGQRQESTRDYFLGGRSLPWWAATLSIIATETSAVTFIGFPREAYVGDWAIVQLVLGFVIGRVFLAFVFVRVFYRSEHVTVYGFLADRFGPATRAVAALSFVLGRVVASGVRLFAGALAVRVATGIDVELIVIAIGVLGGAFTLVGGIRAVVWTDVILGLTFLVGGVVSALFLLAAIPGGIAAVVASPDFAAKTAIFRLDSGIGDANGLICGLLGGFVLTLATHGTDQDIAQRMLTCRDARSGSLSVIGSAVLILPLVLLFLSVGTLLWYFVHTGSPHFAEPKDLNRIFPLYIVRELPAGIAGLVLAGLLAAALSSFTSVLNALAATTIGDFYRPLRRRSTLAEAHYLRVSRVATGFWAIVLIGAALAFVGSRSSIIDLALKVLTYFYGGLLGAFLLGMLTRRGSDLSVALATLASVPIVLALQLRQWVAKPASAPGALESWIADLSPACRDAVIAWIPDIAWPYWIVIGTAVTLLIGASARGRARDQDPCSAQP